MNALTLNNQNPAQTMTSREIAELVELRHDNVKRTIDTLVERGLVTPPQTEEVPSTGPGPKYIWVYRLGKRDTYVIVAQLSPEFTARLVDRWQELEAQIAPTPAVPTTFKDALRLALVQAEQLEVAQAQIAHMTPLATVGSRVTEHRHTLTQIVRTLPGVHTLRVKGALALTGIGSGLRIRWESCSPAPAC